MARSKKTRSKGTPGADKAMTGAIAQGRAAAKDVLAFRARQGRRRLAAERRAARLPVRARAPQAPIPARTQALLGSAASAGVLMAEGDSWFDYPLHDVLRVLEDDYRYDVESVAHKGDTVEEMAHSDGQLEEFARRLEKLLRVGKVPRAILLSGGGNDIAGDEFAVLLNHASSGLPVLNDDIVRGVIEVRVKAAYARIISAITAVCQQYLGRTLPILTHGYDYALPDGRGFLGGMWFLPGPWLKPGFQKKGYDDFAKNSAVIVELIDRFNAMLAELPSTAAFSHVHYLNLRKTLDHGGTYKKDWANELHPTPRGWDLVSQKFATLIATL